MIQAEAGVIDSSSVFLYIVNDIGFDRKGKIPRP